MKKQEQPYPSKMSQGAHDQPAGHHQRFTGIEAWIHKLENPEREKKQLPGEVIEKLGLQRNDVVVDIGAGTGYFAFRIAAAYPQVRVFAADAQQEMVDYLQSQSSVRKLSNLEPVRVDPFRPELPVKANFALLVDTLHHIHDRVAYLRFLRESMVPGSRIAVIDYPKEAPEGPPDDHRLPIVEVVDEFRQVGYTLEQALNFLPNQYFLIFKQA